MPKKSLTPRDRAIFEQNRRKRRAYRKRRNAEIRGYVARILLLAIVCTLIFAGVVVFFVMRNFSSSPEKHEYSLKIMKNGEEVEVSDIIETKDNVCYFSLRKMSEVLGYRIMGDSKTMSAVFADGSTVDFPICNESVCVNGTSKSLNAKIYFAGLSGDVFVPIDFFNGTFEGITLTGEEKGRKIAYLLDVSESFNTAFSPKEPIPLPDLPEENIITPPENEFIADLSEYEEYMNPENPEEYLLLVNKTHPLDKNYIPEDLTDVADTRKDRAKGKMREYAAKALEAMFIEMRANGFTDVSVTSAYRSYEYQEQLFNSYLNQQLQSYDYQTAYEKTQTFSALPGTSEHQSGLCADLHNLPSASQAFASQEVYKWLQTHCADFGFILRFPKDKQDITEIIFEPWHYRYVGRYHAKKIMQSGLCLEEYCEQNGF